MCDFSIILSWKELWRFKVKESMLFVERKYNFNKNEKKSLMENPTNAFREASLVLQPM